MIEVRNTNAANAGAIESRANRAGRGLGRGMGWSVAAAMLAGTALVPVSAQVVDLGAAAVVTSDFLAPAPFTGVLPAEVTNGQLTVTNAGTLNFGGSLTDSLGVLSLTKMGVGTLTLSGTNTYSGPTLVSAGTLTAGANSAFSPNSVYTVNGSALDLAGFDNTIAGLEGNSSGIVRASTAATLTINNAGNHTFSGALQGSLSLVKTGAGTQILNNDDPGNFPSDFTGTVTLNGGRLGIGTNNPLNGRPITVIGNSELAAANASRTLDSTISVNNGVQLSFAVGTGDVFTINGVISGQGSVQKILAGNNTLQLMAANAYTGGTVLSGGRVELGNALALSGGDVTQSGAGVTTIALATPGTSMAIANNFTLSSAGIVFAAPNSGRTLTLNGNITGNQSVTIAGPGTGTVLLNGTNSTTSTVVVESGILGLGSSTALNAGGAGQEILFSPGTGGLSFNAADINLARNISNNTGSAAATINTNGNNATVSGRLHDTVGTLELTKIGAGVLTISNAASGVGTQNALGGGLVVQGGTVNLTGRLNNNVTVNNSATYAGTGTNAGGTTTINSGATLSPGDALAGAGAIGTLGFNNLFLAAGSIINFDLGAPSLNSMTPPNDFVRVAGNLTLGGTLNVNGLTGFNLGGYRLMEYGGALAGTLTVGASPTGFLYAIDTGNAGFIDLTVSLTDFYWDGAGTPSDVIVSGGSGTWNLANTNWADATGTVSAAWGNNVPVESRAFFTGTAGTVTVGEFMEYEELRFETDGYILNSVGDSLAGTSTTIHVVDNATATINLDLTGGGGVTKTGGGTLVLGEASSYTDGTFLNAGRINIANDLSFGADGVTMAAGTTVGTTGTVTILNAFTIAGGVTFDTATSLRINGNIGGGGGFTKTGAGVLALAGVNNFTGNVGVTAGSISLLNDAALGDVANVLNLSNGTSVTVGAVVANAISTDTAAGISNNGGAATLGGVISGNALVTFTGAGNLTLNGNNSYSGGSAINAGTVTLGHNNALGTNTVTMADGTSLANNTNNLVVGNEFSIGNVTVATGANNFTLSNAVNGAGTLTKTGAGTLQLDGANGYTGGTALTAGILRVGTNTALGIDAAPGSSRLTMADGTTLLAGAANLVLDNAITTNGVGTIDTGATIFTLNGAISGSTIVKIGTGSLVLNSAASNYNGGTQVMAGALVLGGPNVLGAGVVQLSGTSSLEAAADANINNNITLAAGSTATISSRGNVFQLDAEIGEAAAGLGFTKTGAGTLILAAANTFTGGVTVNEGIVEVRNNAALGAGPGTSAFNAGTTLRSGAAVSLGNLISVAGGVTIEAAGTNALTLTNDIGGTGGITKTGDGQLSLGGNNGFTGGVAFNAGTINVLSSTGLGDAGNLVTVAADTSGFGFADTVSVANAITLNGNTAFAVAAGSATMTGDINGVGALAKTGAGTLILTGTNSFAGTTISGGRLAVDDQAALVTNGLTFADGTALQLGTAATGANFTLGAVVLNGAATIDLLGANTAYAANVLTTDGNNVAINDAITGAGALTVRGAGRVSLNGDLTGFGGGLVLGDGTAPVFTVLDLNAGGAGSGQITLNGAAINNTSGALQTLTNAISVTANGSFAVVDDLTLSGQITGAAYTKVGTGTLTLSNSSNTAGVSLAEGTLRATVSNALGASVATSDGTTLLLDGTGLTFNATITQNGTLEIQTPGTGSATLSNTITGVGTINKTGNGLLALTADSSATFTGTFNVNAGELNLGTAATPGLLGGDVNVNNAARVTGAGNAAGTATFANGTRVAPGNSPGTLNFGNLVLNNATQLDFELAGLAAVPGTDADLIVVANNLTLDGVLNIAALPGFNVGTGFRTLITYGGALTNNTLDIATAAPAGVSFSINTAAAGLVRLNVAYTGTYFFDGNGAPIDTTIEGGPGIWNGALTNFTNVDGTFNLAYSDAFDRVVQFGGVTAGGAVTVEGTRQFGTINFTDTGYVLGGAGDLSIDTAATVSVTAGTARINNAISGNSVVNKTGAGELVLGSANTYVGNTNVNAGVLTLAVNGATGTGTVNLANGTTLRSQVGSDIAHANAVAITGSATFDVNSTLFSQDALISGGNLVKTGAGTLQLTTNNTYANTDIQTGSFRATQNSSLGVGTVTMADTTVGTWSGGQTVGNAFVLTSGTVQLGVEAGSTSLTNTVGGGATLEKIGAGRLVLNNVANTYAGGSNITAGTLAVAAEGSLGGGNIRFSGTGGTLETLSSFTTAKAVLLDAAGTIDTNANTNRFDGLVTGASSLTKTGAGRLILTGTNTYQGGTNLNVGSLQIDDGNAIGTSTLTTQGGTTLVAGLAPGAGTITLGVANNIVLAGGQTTIDLVGTTFNPNMVTGGVTTNGTNLVINGVISGAGGFTTNVATGGQLVLNGNNTFEGDVTLNNAVATVGNDNSLGVNNTVTLNFAGGVRNATAGTTRTLGNAFLINDPNASLGGDGNLLLTGVVAGADPAILNKVGLGTVTLANADNTISGKIEIAQGELAITGGLDSATLVTTVRSGATLSGTGTIAGTVEVANSAVLSAGIGGAGQVGQLTIGTLLLNEQSSLVFDLGDSYVNGGALNDKIVTTNLRLGGRLTVRESVGGNFGLGVYNLISYQGALLGGSNSVFVQTLPGAFAGTVQTLVAGQVNLVVTQPGTFIQYWDTNDGVGNGVISGGTGTWSALGTNWTGDPDSQLNTNWVNDSVAVFGGTAGTVTLGQTFDAQGLQFTTDGYVLTGGLFDNQSTGVGTGMFAFTDAAVTATINTRIQGDGLLLKQGSGTLILTGNNSNFSGGTELQNGILAVTTNSALGTGVMTFTGGTTLRTDVGVTLANAMVLNGTSTIDTIGNTSTLNGVLSGAGVLTKIGAGNLVLNGANGYTGGSSINVGTVTVGNNTALGTNTVTMADGTVLANNANNLVVGNAFSIGNVEVATGANTFTLAGVVNGAGLLTKTGTGNLILNGANGYTGGSSITAGTVTVGNNTAFGTNTVTMANGTVLANNANNLVVANAFSIGNVEVATGANTFTLGGVVTGAGLLTKTGTGNLILNGANGYTGGTALTAGTITIGNNTALGTNTLTMTGGTSLVAGAAALTVANAITTLGVGTVDTGAFTLTLGGVIDGAGSITKIGTGNLVLNGANGYTGGTTFNAGTVTIGANTALGTGLVTMNNGTAPATLTTNTDNLVVANAFNFNGGVQIIDTQAFALTLNGVLTGNSDIAKTGAGNLILNGANTWAGTITANAGTLTVGNNAAFGTKTVSMLSGTVLANNADNLNIANAVSIGNVEVATGANTFTLSGVVSGTGLLTKTGTGNLILSGSNNFTGGTALTAGTITVGSNTALGGGTLTMTGGTSLVAGAADLSVGNAIATLGVGTIDTGAFTFTSTGVISGAGSITKIGTGNLVLNGANAYTGGSSIDAGTVTVGNNTGLGTNTVTMANATVLANNANNLVVANAFSIGNVEVATGANTFTLGGVVTGAGLLTKTGTGNLVLNGANGYTGGTALTAGAITIGNNTALGTNTLTMTGGTSLVAGAAALTVANAITTLGVGTVDTGAFTLTLGGVIDGAGSITKIGAGNLVLNGANAYTGGSSIDAGTVTVGNNTALGTNTVTMANGTVLANNANNLVVGNAFSIGNVEVATGANTFTLGGVVNGAGLLTKTGTGNLILSGNNGYTGGTALTAGTITFTTNTAFGTGTVTTTGGTNLVAGLNDPSNGVVLSVANAIALGAGTTTVDLQGNTAVLAGSTGINSFSGAQLTLGGTISGAGALSIVDGGRINLNGANSFAGGTTVDNALVFVGTDSALGTGALTVNGSTVLGNDSGALRTLANAVAVNSGLVATGPNDITLTGAMSGGGSLFKSSTSTLTLNGVSTRTGDNNLASGRITLGNNGALGIGSLVVSNSGLTTTLAAGTDGLTVANGVAILNGANLVVESGAGSFTLNGVVSGAGSLTKIQSGTLVLNGANTFTGGTALNVGTIQVGSNTALGTNTLAMADTTTLQAGVAGLTVANNITTAGVGTIDTQAFTFTTNGVISGAGSITKIGTGNLVLNGANGYTGGSSINAGTATVGNNTAFGTALVTMANGTVLANNANNLNVANAFSIGNVEVATGANTFTLGGTVNGAGLLTKTGSGNLILTGNNGYAGGTALTAGTITFNTNTAFGTGTVTTTGGTTLVAGVNDPSNVQVLTLANNIALGAGTTFLDLQGTGQVFPPLGGVQFNGTDLTLNGVVSGDGALDVSDSGRVTLNGANSYAGGTIVTNSAVFVGSDTALGTGTVDGNIMVLGNDSGSLRTLANNFVTSGGIVVTGPNDITLNGVVSGGNSITKTSTSTLTLNAANTYTGSTSLIGGRITVGNNAALGTGSLSVSNFPNVTTLAAGTAGLALANLVSLSNNSNLVVESGAGTFTLNGLVFGSGRLTKIQDGTLVLNGANAFTGGTSLNVGTIQVGTNTALGTNTLAMAGGTTLQAGVNGLTVANNISTAGVGTIDTQAFTFTSTGVISGAGSITKIGSGNLVLNGANTFSGGSSLNAGTVTLGDDEALGTGAANINGAVTLLSGIDNLSIANNVVLNSGVTIDTAAFTTSYTGVISGAAGITKLGSGNLVLDGLNTYAGGTNLNVGSLTVTNDQSIGTGTLATTGGTTLIVGTATGAGTVVTLANAVTLGAGTTTVNLQGTALTFNNDGSIVTNGADLALDGVVSGAGTLATGNFGTLTLNGNNSYTGGTLINSRSVVYVGSDTAVGTGAVTMAAATGLYNESGATRTLANAFVLNGGSWLGGTNDLVLNGAITGAGTLIKGGAQTLVLNGDNSGFTGASQLRDGRITVGTSVALGSGALRVFAPGAAPLGASTTLAAGTTGLALANNVTLDTGSNLVVESGAGNFTLNGVISGAGALTKTQTGTLVLNGANTFTGGTALNVGTIQVGNNTALGTAGLVMADSTTLQAGAADLAVANAITTAGLGTIDTQAFTFTLDGVVDGAGSITKISSGNLVMNNANTYTGGSFINAGTVTVGNNAGLGTSIVAMLDGTTLTTNTDGLALANELNIGNVTVATEAFSFTLNGPIGGGGLLTKTGTGNLVLNGSNAYGGGTALTAGTVTIGANTALGTGQLTMTGGTSLVAGVDSLVVANGVTTLGVGTIDTGPVALTLTGVIDGAGSITKTNRGNLILQGLNAYTGGTLLEAGTITVATNTALGTGLLTMTGGTTLNTAFNVASMANTQNVILGNAITGAGIATFNTDDALTLALTGPISGIGQFNKTGNGLLILNGDNSFSGGFALNAGTLRTGFNTALGTSTLLTAAGTTLQNGVAGVALANAITVGGPLTIDTQAFGYTLNGVISGSGPITKIGSANLTLNGANSFTDGTALTAGSITVGANTALGTGALTMSGGTSLIAGVTGLTVANTIATLGVGTIDTGANMLTLNGVISGDGSITKIGSGNLVLNGLNSYAAGTALNVGTITVATNSALGTGTLAMAGGTTLNAAVNVASGSSTQNVFVGNNITLAAVGTINTGTGLTLLSTGTISGAGSLTKTGTGLLVLNGANTYTGGTAFNAGTIRVGNNTAFGTGNVAAAAGTILQTGVTGLSVANNIAMAGGMTVDNFANQLTLGGVLSGTGPLSVIDSTGGSAGVLTLSGTNTYTGGTVVTGTALRVSSDVNLGNTAGNVTLNRGTLWTTASFASARTIALGTGGGTIQVAPGTALTVNGTIAGTALTKTGGGELVLNTLNSYLGGTTLSAGTITVANDLALSLGAVAMADGTTLNVATNRGTTADTQNVALANNISTAGVGTVNANTGLTLILNGFVSGAGSINKTGAGLVVLNNQNSYTGGTTLAGGTLRTGNGSALGTGRLTTVGGTTLQAGNAGLTVANAITLGAGTTTVDSQAFTYTLSGVASGTGGLTKAGSGVLNLTAASTYTGATTVTAGTLNVTGSLVSGVTVNSGAALTGNGTVGSLNVLAGASVAPGAPATADRATLTVTGAATLAGTYTVNVIPSANDRITAGGALTLGGTLAVVPNPAPQIFTQFNQTFTVASGATRTGTFATVSGLDQFGVAFAPVVEYSATQANIRLAPQSLVVLGNRFGGVSGNALEVARAFDRAVAGGYNPQAFFNVYANGGTALPLTLRQMSGEQRATERRVVLDTNRTFREAALDRLNGGVASLGGQQVSTGNGDSTLTFWLRGAGSWGVGRTSGAATDTTTEQRGVLTGLDWAKSGLTMGGMFHFTTTDVNYQVLGGTSNVETIGGTIYGGYRQDGGLVANAGATVAGARTSGTRIVTLPTFGQSLAGTTTGTTYQGFAELAWDLAGSADTRIEPFARFSYVKADIGALTETGGVAALTAAKQNYDITVTNLGLRFGRTAAGGKVTLNGGVSWQSTTGDRDAATIIGIPAVGQTGLIRSVAMDRDALSAQVDAGVNLSDTVRFSLGYSGLISKNNDDHGARATLNFAF